MTDRVRNTLRQAEYEIVEPAARVVDDASLRRGIEKCRHAGADVLVVLQTTIGDGRLAPVLAQQWPDPVVFWATPENPQGEKVSSCSLVGAHVWTSTLRQLGHRFEVVYGDPQAEETLRRFGEAVCVAYAVRRLRRSKAGLVGQPAPGFLALQADPFTMQKTLGMQLKHFSLPEFFDRVNALSAEDVAEDVEHFRAMRISLKEVADDDLPMASRLYLAMRNLMRDAGIDALAIRCWPEIPSVLGQWPYVGIVRLLSEGRAIGMEGDVDGAVSCFVGHTMGFGCGYLSDWLEHDRDSITLWHPGCAALPLCYGVDEEHGPVVTRQFNDNKPGVVEATLRAGRPVTLFRLWRCDGRYCLTACDAGTIAPGRRLRGDTGRVRVADRDVMAWFEDLCHAGMPHHVAVFGGHHASELRRLARALGIAWVA